MNETINIQDILEVLEHNSIPLEKQIEVLEVLSLALYTRDHPCSSEAVPNVVQLRDKQMIVNN